MSAYRSEFEAELVQLALDAGRRIMAIYDDSAADALGRQEKLDGSPVTLADQQAEEVILAGLARLAPQIPVIAEEAVEAGNIPEAGARYFLVDPLDGTREFLKRNGEFTVNIALIENGEPVFGVVSAPALGQIYWGGADYGAFTGEIEGEAVAQIRSIKVRPAPAGGGVLLASRSHLNEETQALIDRFQCGEVVSVGSSLKFCRIADGSADVYPRLSPTMQWDTAAGDAVLRGAGGAVVEASDLADKAYVLPCGAGKSDMVNGGFFAVSHRAFLEMLG